MTDVVPAAHREHWTCAPAISRAASARLPTEIDHRFRATAYTDADGRTHLALTIGAVTPASPVLAVDECLLGPFRPRSCGCDDRLRAAMRRVADAGSGLVVYLRAAPGALCPEDAGPPSPRSAAGLRRAATVAAIRADQSLPPPRR